MRIGATLLVLILTSPVARAQRQPVVRVDRLGDPLPRHAVGRLGTIRFLPQANSTSRIAWSPDGKQLASLASVFFGASDPGVQIWDPKSGHETGPPGLVHRQVEAMAWGPDSRRLAVCADSSRIEIWDVVKKQMLRAIAKESSFDCLGWLADGKWIAAGDRDKDLTIFLAETGKVARTIPHPSACLDFSHDSKRIAAGKGRRFQVWNVSTGRTLQKIRLKPKSFPYEVDFFQDDQSLLLTGAPTALVDLTAKKPQVTELTDGDDTVVSFSADFSPDGKQFVVGGIAHGRLFDTAAKTLLRRFPEHTGFAYAFSPDGKRIVFDVRRLAFVDAKTGLEEDPFSAHSRMVLSMALSPDGRTAYVPNIGRIIRKWDVESTKTTGKLTLPEGTVRAITISHDGRQLAVAQGQTVHFFNTKTGQLIGKPLVHPGDVVAVTFSPKEDLLVTRCSDGVARFWICTKGEAVRAAESLQLGVREAWLSYSVFSRDGKKLALITPDVSLIEFVNPATRKRAKATQIHEAMVSLFLPASFLPNGQLAHLTVSPDLKDKERVLYHVELPNPAGGLARRLEGPFEYPSAPQGDLIAVADSLSDSHKRVIRIYSTASGKRLAEFTGHVDAIRQLVFSPEGNRLFSVSQDTTALIWSLEKIRAALPERDR